jgi:hypothetical protein
MTAVDKSARAVTPLFALAIVCVVAMALVGFLWLGWKGLLIYVIGVLCGVFLVVMFDEEYPGSVRFPR